MVAAFQLGLWLLVKARVEKNTRARDGVIALKRGLERLGYIIEGIRLEKDVGTR